MTTPSAPVAGLVLLPCPFCGGEPHIERRGNSRFSTIISCLDCGVTHECGDTGDSVGTSWNRRTANRAPATEKLIAALHECEAYPADREDVVDGDYGEPAPNAEMRLLREVRAALAAAQGERND